MLQRRAAVRGNLASFPVHWDDVLERIMAITVDKKDAANLPHDGGTLAHLVRFEFRMKDQQISKHLKHMRLRAYVVLHLSLELIDRSHPAYFKPGMQNEDAISDAKKRVKERLQACFPWYGTERDIEGVIPPEVEKQTVIAEPSRKNVEENKHATPALASSDISTVFDTARPSACAPTEGTSLQGTTAQRIQRAMDGGPVIPYVADAVMLPQWEGQYPAIAFPHTLLWQCGGPDYARAWLSGAQKAGRRRANVSENEIGYRPAINMGDWLAGLTRRVEHQVRSDWLFIPGMRNIYFRFLGITARLGSIVKKYSEETSSAFTQRLTTAVKGLHDILAKGYYGSASHQRPIAGNLTVLHLAQGLNSTQKQIVHNMRAVTRNIAGTQEIRRSMGHVFQSASVGYGHGLFLTISPNEKHSCLVLRLHRTRIQDPLLRGGENDEERYKLRQRLASRSWPSLTEAVDVELPDFDLRLCEVANDPLAVVQAFRVAVNVLLGRLLGIRLCHQCGVASKNLHPLCRCTNIFGSNASPMGGIFGITVALFGAIENQHLGTLHFHGFAYLANMYQQNSMSTIETKIKESPQLANAIKQWHAWVHREEYWNLNEHVANLDNRETEWRNNFRSREHIDLSRWPTYLHRCTSRTKWDNGHDAAECDEDALAFKHAYEIDAQRLFSRLQHHHHPAGKPLSHCIKKGQKNAEKCKHGFPKTLSVTGPDDPRFRVICPTIAKDVQMRVNGPRNALGSILGPRNDEFLSGTSPAFAVVFRSNTHTAPNNRLPLIDGITHDSDCKCNMNSTKAQQKNYLTRLRQGVQRSMSNATKYIGGYISKVQRVGKKARELAKTCLATLAQRLEGKSDMQQTLNTVNRCIGDWEAKGVSRTVFEEVNLAHFADRPNPLAAECITSCPITHFFADCFLKIVMEETSNTNRKRGNKRQSVTFSKQRVLELPPDDIAKAYAWRTDHADLRTLCPYEFVRRFEVVATKPPPRTQANTDSHFTTQWIVEAHILETDIIPQASVHYIVKPPPDDGSYYVLEEDELDKEFKHKYIIVPRKIPALPVFIRSVMPQASMTPERRSAILSAYFRPWTLVNSYSSVNGPVVLARCLHTRTKVKKRNYAAETEVQHNKIKTSFRSSLKEYLRGNIVSEMNRILWKNVLRTLTTMPEICDDEAEDSTAQDVEPLPPHAFPILTVTNIKEQLCQTGTCQEEITVNEPVQRLSNSVHAALEQSMSFWDVSFKNQEWANVGREPALRFSKALEESGRELNRPNKKRRESEQATYYPVNSKHYDLEKKISDWKKGPVSNK